MPLVPHAFDEEKHLYLVSGAFTWSTSNILRMNGFGPPAVLEGMEVLDNARRRGKEVHAAIHAYEENRAIPEMQEDSYARFMAYLRWKDEVGFEVCGPCERPIVYEHEGTGVLVGGTPDLIGTIRGRDCLFVVDVKNHHRQSGCMQQQKCFEWRLQLQSYKEGLAQDEEMWETWGSRVMHGLILHLNPDCGIEKRGAERLGYEQYLFHTDDSEAWHAAIVMARAKYNSGFKLPDKKEENDERS